MATQQEIAAEITHLEALLNSGADSITSDGETVNIDPAAIRRRLSELRSQLTGKRHQARRVRSFDLGNAF